MADRRNNDNEPFSSRFTNEGTSPLPPPQPANGAVPEKAAKSAPKGNQAPLKPGTVVAGGGHGNNWMQNAPTVVEGAPNAATQALGNSPFALLASGTVGQQAVNLFPTMAYIPVKDKGAYNQVVPSTGNQNILTGKQTFQNALQNVLLMGAKDPQWLEQAQQALIQGGYLDPQASGSNGFQYGSIGSGDATYLAFAKLFDEAVASKTPFDQLLKQQIQAAQGPNPKNANGANYWSIWQAQQGIKPYTISGATTQLSSVPNLTGDYEQQHQQLVGTMPTAQQSQDYAHAAQQFLQDNPVQTTTQYILAPGSTSSSLRLSQEKGGTTQGGVNQAGMNAFAQAYIAQNEGPQEANAGIASLVNRFANMLGPGGGAFNGGTQAGQA